MAYDLEEQEQIASMKAWWKQYGNIVSWTLIIALSVYCAWAGWKYYQRNQTTQASQLYDELQKGVAAKDNAKVQRVAQDMEDKFSSTSYAPMTALQAAKTAVESNDADAAKKQLQWAIDNGKDDALKAIARVRLAGVLLDEKDYDAGMKLLSAEFPDQFVGIAEDRKGDILIAQGKLDEARAAYRKAVEKTDQKDPGRQLIQLKLDAIGGAEEVSSGQKI